MSQIPEDNRDASKLGLVFKAFEEAKYQLDEKELRNYFSNLISSSVDNRKNSAITPRFATVLSQLEKDEAILLKKLNNQDRHAILGYLSIVTPDSKEVSKISPVTLVWNRLTYEFEFEKSLDILSSLGVININYDRKLPRDLHELQISELKKCLTFMYGKQYKLEENQKLLFSRGVVPCSELGNQLLDVII